MLITNFLFLYKKNTIVSYSGPDSILKIHNHLVSLLSSDLKFQYYCNSSLPISLMYYKTKGHWSKNNNILWNDFVGKLVIWTSFCELNINLFDLPMLQRLTKLSLPSYGDAKYEGIVLPCYRSAYNTAIATAYYVS